MKIKKIFSLFLLGTLMSLQCTAFGADYVEIERSHSKKDYSSSGADTYKIKATEEQLKAREEARNAYASEMADMSVNMKPMFDDWTAREALAKINNIGTKIVLANEIDDFVRFSVSRKEVVNAYATYHGEIEVYRGLLNYVETEDELAYVLGHELGHIYKKDPRTGMIRRGVIAGALITGAVLAAAAGSGSTKNTGDGLILAGTGGAVADLHMTKAQEARADISGIDFMVKAGYNPLAAISMMNKILDRTWDIVSYHPSGDKRMIAAYNYIEKKYPKYLEGGYDTISYQRAAAFIMKKRAEKAEKQARKEKKKLEKKIKKDKKLKENIQKDSKDKDI